MKLEFRKWLNKKENWRLLNFGTNIITIVILICGMTVAYYKVGEFLDIRAYSIKTDELEAGIIRLYSGMCIFEDTNTTTPNITISQCSKEGGERILRISKEGATTTLEIPE